MPISTPILDNASGTYPTMSPSGDSWANWANYGGSGLQYISGTLAATGAGGRTGAYDSSKISLGDQECGATLITLPANDTERVDFGLRLVNPSNGTTQSGYIIRWAYASTGADTVTCVRVDSNTVAATLFTISTVDWAANDKWRAAAVGSLIAFYKITSGGVESLVGSATDATYSTGAIGLAMDFGAVRVDDYFGGQLGSFMTPVKNPLLTRISL